MQELVHRMVDVFHLELLLQIAVAVVLGGAIGLEREISGKPAGLRTNILICVGAVLFTTLSTKMSLGRGDPARIAAQILPGVGFIGAGTILHMRGSVTGLTSAATIWVVAAIGMALGTAAYGEALGTAFLVLIVLQGLGKVERYVGRTATQGHLVIHAKPEASALEDLEALVERTGLAVLRAQARRENVDLVIEFDVRGPKRLHDQLLAAIVHQPGVRSVSTGE
jgi:putative Mg2+ transporter-C (MgtC) family protein